MQLNVLQILSAELRIGQIYTLVAHEQSPSELYLAAPHPAPPFPSMHRDLSAQLAAMAAVE